METAPTASKSWQPSHEHPRGREKKQATVIMIKKWKERGGTGEGT